MRKLNTVPLGEHKLPSLNYSFSALEPFISEKSLKVHYSVLHRNYVNNLNKTEIELELARKENDFSDIKCLENSLAYNGSGHILHSIFWDNLSENQANINLKDTVFLKKEIENSFKSFENFKAQFTEAGLKTQGSCWAALCWQTAFNRLEILQIKNHQNGTQWGSIPIMVLDVWEHSYYYDYLADRASYINEYWKHIDFENVAKRLELAVMGNLPIKA